METPPVHAFGAKFGFLAKNSLSLLLFSVLKKTLKKMGKNEQKQLERKVLLK